MNKQSLSGAHAAGFAIFCAAKSASTGHHELRAKAVKEDDSVEIIIYNRDKQGTQQCEEGLAKISVGNYAQPLDADGDREMLKDAICFFKKGGRVCQA